MINNITNPSARSTLFGFTVPNMILYGVLIAVVLVVFKFIAFFSGIFNSIKNMLGISEPEVTPQQKIQESHYKRMESNPDVKYQMNPSNLSKCNKLIEALDGFTEDFPAILDVFKTITGPNQMAAVSIYFGIKTFGYWPMRFTGNLEQCLIHYLNKSNYSMIAPVINKMNSTFK